MTTYHYHTIGRQAPVFLCQQAEAVGFTLEGAAQLQVSYDPPHSCQPLWQTYEGGSAGILYGPPTAIRILAQAPETKLTIVD